METEDHEHVADEFEQQADLLARENKRLEDKIDEVRSDWKTKRQDPGVPGATPEAESDTEAD